MPEPSAPPEVAPVDHLPGSALTNTPPSWIPPVKLLWGTYVTGTYGAIPAGMAVDGAGHVIVAGTTNSVDYPITSGAFQTAYTAAGPQAPNNSGNFGPPNSIGYATKVSSGGGALLWSTYFRGSSQEQITGMTVAPSGEILLSGRAASNDLVLPDTPEGCRPSPNQVLGFVARLTPDGASVRNAAHSGRTRLPLRQLQQPRHLSKRVAGGAPSRRNGCRRRLQRHGRLDRFHFE
jgi:hypothetical protein